VWEQVPCSEVPTTVSPTTTTGGSTTSAPTTAVFSTTERVYPTTTPSAEPKRWDKIKKRSSIQRTETVEQDANDERSFIPDIKVYSGAKPFQSRVANLN